LLLPDLELWVRESAASVLNCTRYTRRPSVEHASLFAFFIPFFCHSADAADPRDSLSTRIETIALCFLFYFSTNPLPGGAWSVIECFQPSTSYLYFWFLFSNLVPYLTVLLSHDFSTLYAALRGPTLYRTTRLGVVQRPPRMQNIPRFLRRHLQRRPYSPTSASTPVRRTWTPYTPCRPSYLPRSPHSYASVPSGIASGSDASVSPATSRRRPRAPLVRSSRAAWRVSGRGCSLIQSSWHTCGCSRGRRRQR